MGRENWGEKSGTRKVGLISEGCSHHYETVGKYHGTNLTAFLPITQAVSLNCTYLIHVSNLLCQLYDDDRIT